MTNYLLGCVFCVVMALLVSGCSKAGMLAVPVELAAGDRIIIQYDRAQRALAMPREREEERDSK